jgi:hypothetical protein
MTLFGLELIIIYGIIYYSFAKIFYLSHIELMENKNIKNELPPKYDDITIESIQKKDITKGDIYSTTKQ